MPVSAENWRRQNASDSQAELSGDLFVDGAGNIELPFVGTVQVKDLALPDCQKAIGERITADGILAHPSVHVRINELRPLYILGDVRLPGTYPFRYGSTVQSALALAGGFRPGELIPGVAEYDFLAADERFRVSARRYRSVTSPSDPRHTRSVM
jgi:polysaccharide export outer membrane protein